MIEMNQSWSEEIKTSNLKAGIFFFLQQSRDRFLVIPTLNVERSVSLFFKDKTLNIKMIDIIDALFTKPVEILVSVSIINEDI